MHHPYPYTVQRLMSWAFAFVFLAITAVGCKKDNDPPPPPEERITISVDEHVEVMPGDAVMVHADKSLTLAQVNIVVGGTTVKGYASGDTAFVFILPVMSAGNHTLSIPELSRSNTVTLKVASYAAITDPDAVITDFIEKRNNSIDSITAGVEFQPSVESMTLINQLKEEWELQVSSLNANEKELLAYVLQRHAPEPEQYSFEILPSGYYAKPGDLKSDVGDKLVAIAKNYVTAQTICVGSIPFLVATGYAFLAAPNPLSGAIFLGVFTTFVISREVAIRRAREVGKLKGVAEAIVESDALKPAEFFSGTERSLNMSVSFRNLSTADQSIHPDIALAFTGENRFLSGDREVQSIYTKAAAKTSKLKGAYPGYTSMIGHQSKGTITLPIEPEKISIKSVSDARITYITQVTGSGRMIKISSEATEEIEFNIKVAYRRSLDNQEFVFDIPCIFKPAPAFELTGLWRLNHYTDASRGTMSQSDLINFGNGAVELGWPISYISYPDGKTHDQTTTDPNWTWNQSFTPSTKKLSLTHNYWNVYYRFDYDPDSPNRLIGESIGLSNNGFNLELVKQ